MICMYCGAGNFDQDQTCAACGRPLVRDEARTLAADATIVEPTAVSEDATIATQAGGPGNAASHGVVVPAQSGEFSAPGAPTVAGPVAFPTGQGAPSHPGYPPVVDAYPQYSPMPPAYPNDNSGGMYPGYPGYPGMYPSQMPQTPPVVKAPGKIARPLPRWAFFTGIALIIIGLVVLQLRGSDWAAGAFASALGAISIALLLALALGIRSLAGMGRSSNPRRQAQYISTFLIILVLFFYSGLGLVLQPILHSTQARYLEGQQQWSTAIEEYRLGGDVPPTSVNIARTYNEWGESLSGKQQYEVAISKFDSVLNQYSAVKAEVGRAQSDKVSAYIAWGQQLAQKKDYAGASTQFDTVLNLSYCQATCQDQASTLDATAYYNQAEDKLNLAVAKPTAQAYNDAVATFRVVLARFAKSHEATAQHGDMAKALLGKGKADKAVSCPSAIPTYQELASKFADTPGGKEAQGALDAPQPVTGHFTTPVPRSGLTQAALLQGVPVKAPDAQFFQALGHSPIVTIQSDGHFTFQPLKQGTYDLVWGNSNNGNQSFLTFYQGDAFAYVATVGPLCSYDFGDIGENIPTA